ncbi:Uncharacterised protein [BD1-7 clade bacterium]|uniref:DUF3429 domain-containing protein n=1 Tax=BD1-7 clade bacterium TaxID=2029982 RepID=A0A5S9PMR8_9GAMM|nr:Uncharacterised protein [BD1-7 clade bacterium]CAA0105174.1 Uncharacterised protein [BD1-7 clade bacterium]
MSAAQQLSTQQRLLGYLGLLPFIVGLSLEWGTLDIAGVSGLWLFETYSACIASFVCGIWWGAVINNTSNNTSNDTSNNRSSATLVLSNVLCLLAWVSLLLDNPIVTLLLLGGVFFVVLVLEKQLKPHRADLQPYFAMRRQVTGSVVILHLVMVMDVAISTGA